MSYRRNVYSGKTAFVARITLVKGVPFYGYHVGYKFFLKIYLFNPLHVTRLADLLRQGAIMKSFIQTFESHLQYLAQWMCDFNLYGCAYIDCSEVKFRTPVPNYLEINNTSHRWHNRTIDASFISDHAKLPRQSHCSIEVDICVHHILNRLDVKARPIHHDFIERKDPLAPSEKLVQSMAGLWRDETRRRKARLGEVDHGSSPFPPEVLISMSADSRNSQPGGWIHEKEYAGKIQVIVKDEGAEPSNRVMEFDTFVEKAPFEEQIKTTLESVEDLFPENLARAQSSHLADHTFETEARDEIIGEPEVDESLLFFEDDEHSYESDEDLARDHARSQNEIYNQMHAPRENSVNMTLSESEEENYPKLNDTKYTERNKGTSKSTSSEEALCFNSSDELGFWGVRNPGNHNDTREDEFAIPMDFTSKMSTGECSELTSLEPKRKKMKVDSNEKSVGQNRGQPSVSDHASGYDQSKLWTNMFWEDHETLDTLDTSNVHQKSEFSQRKQNALPRSRDKNGGNNTLAFRVVKDPLNPDTILKLSQNSSSSIDRVQKCKSVSVSSRALDPTSSKRQKFTHWISSADFKLASPQVLLCSSQIHWGFEIPTNVKILCLQDAPPQSSATQGMRFASLPSAIYQGAYFSHERDVPDRAREYAGKDLRVTSVTIPFLPDFDPDGISQASYGTNPGTVYDKAIWDGVSQQRRQACAARTWEMERPPPTRNEVQAWLRKPSGVIPKLPGTAERNGLNTAKADPSQIDGPTQKNRCGFKYSQKQKSTRIQRETQYMSLMGLEIHVTTRGALIPDPEHDRIESVFWCLRSDDEDLEVNGMNEGTQVGVIVLSEAGGLARQTTQHTAIGVEEETSELDLLIRMVDVVRYHDPDILTGYEVHSGSWGFLIERARLKYDLNLVDEFSRMKAHSQGRIGRTDDRWGFNHTSTIRISGRHMINIWRAMRGELNLLQYTMENVVFQLCHRRIPHYSFQDLSSWYSSGKVKDLTKVMDYYISRVQLDIEILEQNELVPRTSEQARLLGVDFFSVFSRGSQFKVESLMFRIAKPENFLLPSPSRKQVGQQNALECLPLVMEPHSAFYSSPMLVLDFQSLYPSVMIAYNYCYSTFLGRVVSWRGQNKMGFTDFKREPRLLGLLKDQINIAPNGIMYAKPEIRKSLLAKMLGEILETRVMVKSGMKVDKDDRALQRLLNNRQLALKLIANVTYGYTSASFSGRMPCSEIADSIVQTGRETLEKAIALIHSVGRWGAEVVYGDTDSLFVYLKGRTKDEAFNIGEDIANTITSMNPRPVKLKFEKVYFPCILLAKKRYVGFKYESRTQKEPEFDAKGIETVRRDGTPAEQKIEEKALKILFRTADLSEVRHYVQRQCSKIMQGTVSIQDFCFAKEVKLGTYSDKGHPPPGALISTRRMLEDPRAEPQYGERVPFVVITGAPGARLIDRCVPPDVLLHNDNDELDAEYYILKNIIPPLDRIFSLVGVNVRQWYDEMPKYLRTRRVETGSFTNSKDMNILKKTLESFMKSSACLVCLRKLVDEEQEDSPICIRCMRQADYSLLVLRLRLVRAEKKAISLNQVCRSCAGFAWGEDIRCDSHDCPVFYSRKRQMAELRSSKLTAEPVMSIIKELSIKNLDW